MSKLRSNKLSNTYDWSSWSIIYLWNTWSKFAPLWVYSRYKAIKVVDGTSNINHSFINIRLAKIDIDLFWTCSNNVSGFFLLTILILYIVLLIENLDVACASYIIVLITWNSFTQI